MWRLALPLVIGAAAIALVLAATSPAEQVQAGALDYTVTDISLLLDGLGQYAGHLDWSADGNWIAYDKAGGDDYTDTYIIHPDGTGNTCLTCSHPDLPNRHTGNSDWHPDGRWLLFQAEKGSHWLDFQHSPCRPGGGFYNDLYVMDLESETPYVVYKIRNVRSGTPAGGSLHPHFSNDGSQILWGDLEGSGGNYGNWRMAVGDFDDSGVTPTLTNISYYQPATDDNWYETHGFGPDDDWIYFACTDTPGMNENAMDICRMDFSNPNDVTRLAFTSGEGGEDAEWDEHAQMSPLEDAIAYMSSNGYGVQTGDDYHSWLKTDMWLTDMDGTNHTRITYFNEPGHGEYLGDTIVADNSWNPNARRLAVGLAAKDQDDDIRIYIVSFSIGGATPTPTDTPTPTVTPAPTETPTPTPTPTDTLFTDGFECGDTSAWARAQLGFGAHHTLFRLPRPTVSAARGKPC